MGFNTNFRSGMGNIQASTASFGIVSDSAALLEADFHFEIDSLGSREELAK